MTPLAQLIAKVDSLQRRVIYLENRLRTERVNYSDLVVGHLRAIDLADVNIRDVAHALNTSGTTLRRRLLDEGVKFKDLLQCERRRRVEAELARDPDATSHTLAVIAGYSDTQNLTRAFAKWFGLSLRKFKSTHGATP